LTVSGEVYTFGCGKDARLGHGQSIDVPNQDIPRLVAGLRGKPVTHIAVGEYHMAAVLDNGEVWTFGKNRHGQLGHKDPKPGHPSVVEGLAGVRIVKAVCGRQHTMALSEDGQVFGWGDSTLGAVGTGSKAVIPSPVQVSLIVARAVHSSVNHT
jgi:alpha-tubulin suppressor-like RCC1 family protein